MNDRETLAANFARYVYAFGKHGGLFSPMLEAVSERLAQLPEKCGTCGGRGFLVTSVLMGGQAGYAGPICPTCHGRGTVYPAELVERIAKTIFIAWFEDDPGDWSMDLGHHEPFKKMAVAVLDAINDFAADKPGREG